jgi:hypothetical protein
MSRKRIVCLALLGIAVTTTRYAVWQARRARLGSSAWKEAHGNEDNPIRSRMVGDLLARHQLVGMSKDEVDELLGPPFLSMGASGSSAYFYRLGPQRHAFSNVESEWLSIKFEQAVVTEPEVVKDSALPPHPLLHILDGG